MSSIEQAATTTTDTDTAFQCNLCKKSFSCKTYLNNHILRHQSTERIPCELCDKTFSSKGHLTAHVLQHHNKIKKYCCAICNGKFTGRLRLKRIFCYIRL